MAVRGDVRPAPAGPTAPVVDLFGICFASLLLRSRLTQVQRSVWRGRPTARFHSCNLLAHHFVPWMAVQAGQQGRQGRGVGNSANGVVVIDVSDPDSGDDEILSRKQVKNLLWIEGSKRHMKALEFWRRQDDLCTRRVDSKRKQSLAVKNEVYQLIGFYSVFQGVLLTAVSQSNLLHCNNQWSAFSLSGLASFVAFVGICQKFLTVWELERTIESEKASRQIYVTRSERLLAKGKNFKFHKHAKDSVVKPYSRQWKLSLSIFGIIVVLLLFSGTFLASIHRILCHPDLEPSP